MDVFISNGGVAPKTVETFLLLLFDDSKIQTARKPGKKQKENQVGCTKEGEKEM